MFRIKNIDNKKEWEGFILSREEANFLQSWSWGEFQESLGKKVFRLGIFENDKQIGACEMVKEEAKRGKYLTIAGGPILDWGNENLLEFILEEIKKVAKEEDCSFVRLRPQALDSQDLRLCVEKMGLKLAPMHVTADLTLQLDLSQSEEEILKQMRKNTRYDIRRSEKLGIKVEISEEVKEIDDFYERQLFLAKKHGFVPFSLEFLNKQFTEFVKDDQVLLIHALKDDEVLASAFVIFYNGEAVYHYGVSTEANDRLPGAYACQWAAIKEAKRRGCRTYNFWGVAPEEEKEHRFAGVSIFKRGFGGSEVAYLPAYDLIVSNTSYLLTKGFEIMRKKMRRL